MRQEEVQCQEQPFRRPARHQRGPGSQKKKSRPHNIIYELHCALRLSALVGIFRNAVKELIGSLRLTAEADLALESQSPVDDSSLLRMRLPSCAFEAMEIRILPTQAEIPGRGISSQSSELPEGVLEAMSGLGHRMLHVMQPHDGGTATTLNCLRLSASSNTQCVNGYAAKSQRIQTASLRLPLQIVAGAEATDHDEVMFAEWLESMRKDIECTLSSGEPMSRTCVGTFLFFFFVFLP